MRLAVLLSLVLVSLPATSFAQAYCALRDPVRVLYDLFPEAESYRSVVRDVDEDAREAVLKRLGMPLHRRELGRHTLYLAMKGDALVGYVHVRSEKSKWGLVEIAWGLDPELRVVDYRFQRCRSRSKSELEDGSFRQQLAGRSLSELRGMLARSGEALNRDAIEVDEKAQSLALVVLRCAVKTVVTTEVVWGDALLPAPETVPASSGPAP